jgi:adenosylcobinamide-GDP ribazoletransferase
MRWFPLVGALIGGIVAGVDAALAAVASPEVRSVVAVALLAGLTGALHLDGLMDTCDAVFAVKTPAERLAIMRDSRVGSFGIVGAACVLLLKYAAILSLPAEARVQALIAMAVLSRWAMVYATSRYPTARLEGMAFSYRSGLRASHLALATVLAAAFVLPAGLAGAGYWLTAWLTTTMVASYARSKVGGLTGDVYGAISEAVETSVALAAAPLWRLAGS